MQSISHLLHHLDETKAQSDFHPMTAKLLKQLTSASEANAKVPFSFLFTLDKNECEYLYLDGDINNMVTEDSNFIKNNHSFFHSWNPNDAKMIREKIFPLITNLCRENNKQGEPVTFSFNFRFPCNAGEWLTLLQTITCINALHNDNDPLQFMGAITDITHFKDDHKIIFVAEKKDLASNTYQLIKKLVFASDKEDVHLTKREIEVLQCIHDGLSSKQIADKLFASLNTINNHRKNILKKTHAKNISELISFSHRNGLL